VSKLDDKEEEELVFLDSKISKVSTVCGKLLTVVQQNQIAVDDSLRSLLADLIDAVKVTNEVRTGRTQYEVQGDAPTTGKHDKYELFL
jgi:hypothetical protein